MIPDNTVQKERAIMDAGGLSPNMASFLMQDAKNINRNPNFPEVHYKLDRGKQFRAVEQHSPLLERGLW